MEESKSEYIKLENGESFNEQREQKALLKTEVSLMEFKLEIKEEPDTTLQAIKEQEYLDTSPGCIGSAVLTIKEPNTLIDEISLVDGKQEVDLLKMNSRSGINQEQKNTNSRLKRYNSRCSEVQYPSHFFKKLKPLLQESGQNYLENNYKLELDIKTKYIKLEERKLVLEKRKASLFDAKAEIEQMERLQRLKFDARMKEAHLTIIKQQLDLMSLYLLNKNLNENYSYCFDQCS